MVEVNASGSMSGGAVKEAQQAISEMAKDMAKIETASKEIAKQMKSAATSAKSFQGKAGGITGGGRSGGNTGTATSSQSSGQGGSQASGTSLTAAGLGAGGVANTQGIPAGQITAAGSMNNGPPAGGANMPGPPMATGDPAAAGRMGGFGGRVMRGAGNLVLGTAKLGLMAARDLLPTGEEAVNYEWLSRRARFGMGMNAGSKTGGYEYFNRYVQGAVNNLNVLNKEQVMGDVAEYLHMGMGSLMTAPGVSMDQANMMASKNVGSMHTLAAMGGLSAESINAAMGQISSAQSYYKGLASGVMTRSPTGRAYSIEEIINQYAVRYNGDEATLTRQFAYGSMGRLELEQTYGPEAADVIIEGLLERARSGGTDLKPGDLEARAKETGAAGTKYTQGLDTTAARHKEEIAVLGSYQQDVTNGVATANKAMEDLNEKLANLDGAARDAAAGLGTLFGALDAFSTGMPNTYGAASSMAGNAMGSLLGGLMGGAGAAGGARGARALLGGGRGMAALRMGGRALGPIGLAVEGYMSYQNIQDAMEGGIDRDWTGKDTAVSIGGKALAGAATGALLGSFVPGIGNLVGGAVGGAIGGLWGLGESLFMESKDPGHAKGDWFVEKDQDTRIHQGEMILPSRVAQSVRDELDTGRRRKGGGGTSVIINLTVQNASDQEAMMFSRRVKRLLDQDNEMISAGEGVLR